LLAGFWGAVAGAALLIGAAFGYGARIAPRIIAAVMAFGSGVLMSTLSFDLMDEAYRRGGFDSVAMGFLGGAAVYTAMNVWLSRRGARHRKRSSEQQPSESENPGSGLAIALGALLDGIPESMVIGLSLLHGGAVSSVTVAGVFISNIPEGLSSSAGMRRAGRHASYVFTVWGGIAFLSGLAALAGYVVFAGASADVIAGTTAAAAGAILAMLADTMIPEAFSTAHDLAGLITVIGFLLAFALTKLQE
jgi:ZIP family zinc transporter